MVSRSSCEFTEKTSLSSVIDNLNKSYDNKDLSTRSSQIGSSADRRSLF